MKQCENKGCKNTIKVPSLDCPGQCLQCAIESRKRVKVGLQTIAKAKKNA